jgi:hypothetical protein
MFATLIRRHGSQSGRPLATSRWLPLSTPTGVLLFFFFFFFSIDATTTMPPQVQVNAGGYHEFFNWWYIEVSCRCTQVR